MTLEATKEKGTSTAILAEKIKKAEEEARKKAIANRERFFGLQIKPTASYYNDAEEREPGDP